MKENQKKAAWENCKKCNCNEYNCNPNTHRLCGICGDQLRIEIDERIIMKSAYDDANSWYGWNIDHRTPISRGGTNKNENLRAVHIRCNQKRGNN